MVYAIQNFFIVAFSHTPLYKSPQSGNLSVCKSRSLTRVGIILFVIKRVIVLPIIIMQICTGFKPDIVVLDSGIIIRNQLSV